MSVAWSCFIPGPPVAKGRPRLSTRGGYPRIYTPHRTKAWESMAASVIRASWGDEPLTCATVVSVLVLLPRPKRLICSHVRACSCSVQIKAGGALPHTGKPDIDNLVKAALDALVRGGAIEDDRLVTCVTAIKHYASTGGTPGVTLVVTATGA